MTDSTPRGQQGDRRDAVAVVCFLVSVAIYPVVIAVTGRDCKTWGEGVFPVTAAFQCAVGMICVLFGRPWVSVIPFALFGLGLLLAFFAPICKLSP